MIEFISPTHIVTYESMTINVYHANKGQGLPSHSHLYSHLTICHAGSCIIRKEGKELVMTKDTKPVNLLADGWHSLEALEDGTVFCNVFAEGKY